MSDWAVLGDFRTGLLANGAAEVEAVPVHSTSLWLCLHEFSVGVLVHCCASPNPLRSYDGMLICWNCLAEARDELGYFTWSQLTPAALEQLLKEHSSLNVLERKVLASELADDMQQWLLQRKSLESLKRFQSAQA